MPTHDQTVPGRRRPRWTRKTIELSYPEALALHSLARWKRRKHERQLAKSTFVPEPGHAHAGEAALKKSRALEERLMAFVESYPEYNPDEWLDDDSAADARQGE